MYDLMLCFFLISHTRAVRGYLSLFLFCFFHPLDQNFMKRSLCLLMILLWRHAHGILSYYKVRDCEIISVLWFIRNHHAQ